MARGVITITQKGDFSKATQYMMRAKKAVSHRILAKYGAAGVSALASATPVETGLTANSWTFDISGRRGSYKITFKNTNIQNGVPIAIILFYGHGTRNGGWVEGRDYINPAIQPIFDQIANEAWREVTRV